MKLIVRRKIAVPHDERTPFVVEVSGTEKDPQTPLEALMRALSFDARKDGVEGSELLMEVTDHG